MNLKLFPLLLTLFLINATHVHAQKYKWDWAAMGLGGSAGGPITCTDKFSNILVAGGLENNATDTFGSFIVQAETGISRLDTTAHGTIVVVKYDPGGNAIWANASKNGIAFRSGIDADELGNVYLFGYYKSASITFGQYTLLNPDTGFNYFLVKYSPEGDVINAFNIFSIDKIITFPFRYDFYFQFNGLCIRNDNLYVVLAYNGRKVNFGSFSVSNNDTSGYFSDLLVAKLDSIGKVKWAKSIGGASEEIPLGIGVTNDENIYLGCLFSSASMQLGSFAVNLQNSPNYENTVCIKLDSTGSVTNVRNLGGSISNPIAFQVVNPVQEVLIGGVFDSAFTIDNVTLAKTQSGNGNFLAKFDTNLSLSWLKDIGDSVCVTSITGDACGNIWICGTAFYDSVSVDGHPIHLDVITGYDWRMYVAGWTDAGNYITASVLPTGGGYPQIAGDRQGNLYVASLYGHEDNNFSFPYTIGRSTLFDSYYDSANGKIGYEQITDIFVAKFKVDTPTTVCLEKNTSLKAPDEYITYSWKDGTTAVSHPADSFGVNWVTSIGTCKYNVSIDTFILEQCHCPAFVPNAFTPNDDGKNDEVHPLFQSDCAINDYNFAIFNRFGEAVFKSRNPSEKWNGRLHGVPAETSTYFYYLEYKGGYDKKSYSQKGDITLIR